MIQETIDIQENVPFISGAKIRLMQQTRLETYKRMKKKNTRKQDTNIVSLDSTQDLRGERSCLTPTRETSPSSGTSSSNTSQFQFL